MWLDLRSEHVRTLEEAQRLANHSAYSATTLARHCRYLENNQALLLSTITAMSDYMSQMRDALEAHNIPVPSPDSDPLTPVDPPALQSIPADKDA